jgi:hypothetical protein
MIGLLFDILIKDVNIDVIFIRRNCDCVISVVFVNVYEGNETDQRRKTM